MRFVIALFAVVAIAAAVVNIPVNVYHAPRAERAALIQKRMEARFNPKLRHNHDIPLSDSG